MIDVMSIVERFNLIVDRLSQLGLGDYPLARSRNPTPVILFCGAIKSGKSSLINDLVGRRLLPDAHAVTDTRLYGRLTTRPDSAARLITRDGEERYADLTDAQALLSKATGDDPRLPELDRVEIQADTGLGAFEIEDSPGHSDASAETMFARQDILVRATASTLVVYVMAGKSLVPESEAEFLLELQRARVPTVIVLSRWDEVDPEEEDDDPRTERIRLLEARGLGRLGQRIHCVSSYDFRGGVEPNGVSALKDVLVRAAATADSLIAGQQLRELVVVANLVIDSATEAISSSEAGEAANGDLSELRLMTTLADHERAFESALDVFRMRAEADIDVAAAELHGVARTVDPSDVFECVIGPKLDAAWESAREQLRAAYVHATGGAHVDDVDRLLGTLRVPNIPLPGPLAELPQLEFDDGLGKIGEMTFEELEAARDAKWRRRLRDDVVARCHREVVRFISSAESGKDRILAALQAQTDSEIRDGRAEHNERLAAARQCINELSRLRDEVDTRLSQIANVQF